MINGLGERLKQMRTERNLSQKNVANALDVSAAVISNYESSERTPSVEVLMALARLYQTSPDYLLGFQKYITKKSIDVSGLSDTQYKCLCDFIASLQDNPTNKEK